MQKVAPLIWRIQNLAICLFIHLLIFPKHDPLDLRSWAALPLELASMMEFLNLGLPFCHPIPLYSPLSPLISTATVLCHLPPNCLFQSRDYWHP